MQRQDKNYEDSGFKLQEPEQTKEEFYKWFENKGLLSDLRAYMRQLMVKALTDSNKNEISLQLKKASSSPKLQAINLLVVDYLFHEDYLYTVSVFSSEAQILDSLPQYSQYVTETVRERNCSLPRFSRQEAEDILDTLHLPSSPHTLHQAVNTYLSGTESLFTCVVRTLASSYNQSLLMEPRVEVPEGPEVNKLWSQEMQDLLLMAGVKLQHIQRLQQRWSKTIEEEKLKARKEAEEEEVKVQGEKEREMKRRLRAELEEEMRVENEELRAWQSRVEEREQGLANLASQLTAVNEDVNHRLSDLQSKKEELETKEIRQRLKKLAMENQIRQLQIEEEKEYTTSSYSENCVGNLSDSNGKNHESPPDKKMTSTKDVCVQTENIVELNVSSTQTSEPGVTVGIQTANNVDSEQQTSQEIQPDSQIMHQLQREQEKISELLEENLELRAHALQQRQRIDELTNRATSLSAQLEENRIAVAVLSGREEAQIANPVPAPPAFVNVAPHVAFVPTFGFNTPQRAGAGEESLFTPRPPQTNCIPDHRRRSLRFSFSQNQSPTSDESSHTDEVVQNARSRIRQLEEESAAVQRNYQAFQSRLLSTDPFIFPPLGPPRLNRSVLRVRRNDGIPVFPFTTQPHLQVNNLQFHRSEPQEELDNSSSDRGVFYETSRIESLTNTRRFFNQRNMRQFERWKQFKKKYQRRDTLDQTRRTAKQNHCNSSSEDENRALNTRYDRERSRTKRVSEKRNEQMSNITHEPDSTQEIRDSALLEVEQIGLNIEDIPNVDKNTVNSHNLTTLGKPQNEEDVTPFNPSILDLRARKSEQLIASLKNLLGKNEKRQTSNLSEGSMDLESLPRDSVNITQENIEPMNLSILVDNTDKPKTVEQKDNSIGTNILDTQEKSATFQSDGVVESEGDNIRTQVTSLQPLTAPTSRLHSQNQQVENIGLTIDVVASLAAGVKHVDPLSSSVTSGSDILRELNSKSSTSVSVGFEESKHSSDFWE